MEPLEQSIDFIGNELIPEMVHDRCFCEENSREFVELESVRIEPVPVELSRTSEIYRAKAIVSFSGEPRSFPLLVKLLPEQADESQTAFDAFRNETMFYTTMTREYGTDFVPKCYLADLGRYGRPAVVLEDLREAGYAQVDGVLDEDHLKLCVKVLGKFHGRGLRLKATEKEVFEKFDAELMKITFTEESMRRFGERSTRILGILESMPNSRVAETFQKRLDRNPARIIKTFATEFSVVSTICHGYFSHDNLLFRYENGRPVDVKVVDWQTMRYCSPAVDLGPILLYNMTHESRRSEMEEMLTLYVDTVQSEYPDVDAAFLREDIVRNVLFAFVVLSSQDHVTDDELARILQQFERQTIADSIA